PHFALDVTDSAVPLDSLGLPTVRFTDTRGLATSLPMEDAGILAEARALIDWHTHHRFCAMCGAPTTARHGGTQRKCDSCGTEHFPRINPAVIMVVWREDRLLLGRRRGRPAGSFSCIAGYVDTGESIEEAVRREVSEEVGLPVGDVQYFSSQPWPLSS